MSETYEIELIGSGGAPAASRAAASAIQAENAAALALDRKNAAGASAALAASEVAEGVATAQAYVDAAAGRADRAATSSSSSNTRSAASANSSSVASGVAVAARDATLAAIAEAGGAIDGAISLQAASRSILAAIASPTPGLAAYLSEPGCEGDFVWYSTNFQTQLGGSLAALDPNKGLYVPPAGNSTGAAGAWKRAFSGNAQVSWFGWGAAGNTPAQNTAAANQALATLKALAPVHVYSLPGSIGLDWPEGVFSKAGPILVTHPLDLRGKMSNPFGGGGTLIECLDGTDCFSVTPDGYGANFEGFHAVGDFVDGGAEADAHMIRSTVKISGRKLRAQSFGGDLLNINSPGGAANGNESVFDFIMATHCRWTTNIFGGDGNNCTISRGFGYVNRRGIHFDRSFLGNEYPYAGGEGNGNHVEFPTRCTFSGNQFMVVNGQEAWCSTHSPPATATSNQGWAYIGPTGSYAPSPTWVTGVTWYFGAPCASENANARSYFGLAYQEGDQNPSMFATQARWDANMAQDAIDFGGAVHSGGTRGDANYGLTATGDFQVRRNLRVVGALALLTPNLTIGVGTAAGSWAMSEGVAYLAAPDQFKFRNANTSAPWFAIDSTAVTAGADNARKLGDASLRWSTVYAASGSINTSDERMKTTIKAASDNVLDAWEEVEWTSFQFKDAVKKKKKAGARVHFGLVAQRVLKVFEKHGLDAFGMGLLCFDEWAELREDVVEKVIEEVPVEVPDPDRPRQTMVVTEQRSIFVPKRDEDGEVITQVVVEAGDLFGIRYEEALALEAAMTRRRLTRIEDRLAALEAA